MKRIASIMATTALVLGLFAASPSAVSATSFASAADVDHWVSKSGRLVNDASGGYSCSRPGYRLIADAAEAAEPGDVIHVCRGTYTEYDIELPSDFTSGITIQGDGPNRTFIDARGNGRVFITWNGIGEGSPADLEQLVASNLRIADMTLRNADANDSDFSTGLEGSGGLIIGDPGDVFDDLGGAVLSIGRVECNNVRFTGNHAEAGGAIASLLGVTANRCSFTGNTSEYSGGAIWSLASVHDSGGVYTANATEDDFGGAIFSNNLYGVVFAFEAADASHLTSSFTNTAFSKNMGVDGGGAVAIELGCAEISNSSFTRNSTNGAGGGLYLNEGSFNTLPFFPGGIPDFGGLCQSEISNSKFESNAAVSEMGSLNVGGGLAYFGGLDDSSTGLEGEYDDTVGLRMVSTTFKSNAAANGGAVFMDDGILRSLGGVNFYGNRARQNGPGEMGGYGSGVYAVDHSVFTGSYDALSKNRATFEPNSVVYHQNGTMDWTWGADK